MADNLRDWLASLELEHLTQVFEENQVSLRDLPLLAEDDLKELGLALGPRKRLLSAIADLSPSNRTLAAEGQSSGEPPPASAERRQLTVLFCDLVGSTELSQRLDPEDMREVMRAYQDAVAGEVARYEGHVAKFMGDGVIAYFGYPRAHEDDAERAIRSALSIVQAIPELNLDVARPLQIRIGIATGHVVVGDLIGEGAAQEEAVVGDTPNLAARLQELATPNSILVSAATRELTGNAFDCTDLGLKTLKGFAEPDHVWEVDRERPLESRFAARAARLTTFVGRDHEVGLLSERWLRVKEGEGQVVLLSGEAGIGKSRILETLRDRLAQDLHVRVRYQCSPFHSNSALYPMIGQMERDAGFAAVDDVDTKVSKLERLLAPTSEDLGQVMPLMGSLLSLPVEDRYPPLDLTPQQQKARTLDALFQQLSALARQQPVLFLFEDVHWIDPTSLELLELIVDRLANLRVMVIITHRPEFEAPWQRYGHVSTLSLNRLSRSQCGEMVLDLASGKLLPEEVLEQIIGKTDGVPLFVEELTKTILESALLQQTAERYVLAGSMTPLAIPSTLQDSLMARLDRLGAIKEIAQIGAAIGREFPHRLLAAVSPLSENELHDTLNQLVESELVFRHGAGKEATYVFKHALVQDVAYSSLLRSRRRALHLRIAEALAETFAETVETEPELLAHHYTEAGLTEQAIDYWQKAGERALRGSANVEAINHLMRGLELLETLPESRERDGRELSLQLTLGPALMAAKGQGAQDARQAYSRARELGQQLGDTRLHFRALWGYWRSHLIQAEYDTARVLGEQSLSLAEESQDAAFILEACFMLGGTLMLMGNFAAARPHLERAVPLYDIEKHRSLAFDYGQDPCATILSYLSWTLWYLGFPERALQRAREALALAEALGHPLTLAQVLNYSAMSDCFCRDWRAARSRAEANMELSKERGFPQTFWLASGIHARVLVEEGRFEDGMPQFEEAVAERKAIGVKAAAVFELALLAEAYGAANRVDEGLSVLATALEFADRTGEGLHLPEIRRLKGELLLRQDRLGSADGAANCFLQALDAARGQQAKSLELRAASSLARLWRDQGKTAEARDLLAPIYGWFTEGFDTPDLKDAKALLDELA